MQMMLEGNNSYWSWACSLTSVTGKKISKQAIFYRMNKAWVSVVKKLVGEVIAQQAVKQIKHRLFEGFENIWLQDSTCVQLPDALAGKFSGNVVNGKKKSVAKLNIIIHALSGLCPLMEWNSFTVTEQSLTSSILGIAKAGDLVIRDLGYFVLKIFTKMDDRGIFFLSKWKYGVLLYDVKSGRQIDLLQRFNGRSWIDMEVICGKEEQLKVRLVAIKISVAQANERRRKASKDRHPAANHNGEYYALLDYVIFITNVSDKTWYYRQVADAYRIRWNVEILFKSWKSGFGMTQMIPEARTHTNRIESFLYLLLLYIAWFQILVYSPLRWELKQRDKQLSIIKAANWMIANTMRWITGAITPTMRKEIMYLCCYDKRARINGTQRLEAFLSP